MNLMKVKSGNTDLILDLNKILMIKIEHEDYLTIYFSNSFRISFSVKPVDTPYTCLINDEQMKLIHYKLENLLFKTGH